MKPILLEMEYFLPYAEKQIIDFTKLDAYGLFLIHGKTGSGKTSILDGITYALFGESSSGTRGDAKSMRSKLATDANITKVNFEFILRGKQYKFAREIIVHTKRSGEREIKTRQNAFYKKDKDYIPYFENPKIADVKNKAQELLGLTYEQFKQVIILPQGQFERFLVASSEDKESILSTLFNAQYIENITNSLTNRALELKHKKEETENKIKGALDSHNCENSQSLSEVINSLAKEKAEAEALNLLIDKEFKRVQEEYNSTKIIAGQFNEYDKLIKEEAILLQQKGEVEEKQSSLQKAKIANSLLPLRENAATAGKATKERKAVADRKFKEIQAYKNEHNQSIERLFGCYKAKLARQLTLKGKIEVINDRIKKQGEDYKNAFEGYMSNCTYALGENLKEGEECPVCGSRVHTKKALNTTGTYTLADVKKAEQTLNKEQKVLRDESTSLALIERDLEILETERAKYPNAEGGVAVEGEVSKCIEAISVVANKIATASELWETAKAEYEKAKGEFEEKMEEFKTKCLQHGFESDKAFTDSCLSENTISNYEKAIQDYNVKVEVNSTKKKDLQEKLKDIPKPDFQKKELEYKEISAKKQNCEKQVGNLEGKLEGIKKTYKDIIKKESDLAILSKEYVELDNFAKLLRGSNGVGLKRYVLGAMLIYITIEANKLLKLVHGGRFQIQKQSDYSGRTKKVGLELEVMDGYSGEYRNVQSLSGGEKFLVALSLSFGLSSVVQMQKGGISIDSMFVDEGFGSLDPASIEDALSILAEVKGQRLIGIISHVQKLKESIECGIEVVKEREGSFIRFLG